MKNKNSYKQLPDEKGYFGKFGGRYVSETLMPLILEVEKEYNSINPDGIDLSSGVEESKGIKSEIKIKNFINKYYAN